MPQLNPFPWLSILVFSWVIFLLIIPHKLLKHTFNNEPTPIGMKKPKTQPWGWPW